MPLYLPGIWLLELYGEAAAYYLLVTVLVSAAVGALLGEDVKGLLFTVTVSTLVGLSAAFILRLLEPGLVVIYY